jgi:hypothetical protein
MNRDDSNPLVDQTTEPEVREQIEKAILNRTPFELFLNSYGEQETLDLGPRDPDEDEEADDAERLLREKYPGTGRPSFDVCAVIEGRLIDPTGKSISLDDLPNLHREAEDERVRFYTERAKEFGPFAWPGGAERRIELRLAYSAMEKADQRKKERDALKRRTS